MPTSTTATPIAANPLSAPEVTPSALLTNTNEALMAANKTPKAIAFGSAF